MEFNEHARPILTIHVGQAGVQIGNAMWELLCLEHNIRPDGIAKPDCQSNGFYDAVFVKSASGHFMPRAILVDTDPTCIDEVRVGPYHDLFSSKQLLSDNNDASFNYMKGRHEYKSRLVPNTVERFRWLLEKSDIAPTVFLIHGISGGTGSGFTVSSLEEIRSNFGTSIPVIDMMVSSGRSGQQNSCELINQVLYHYETKDLTNVAFTITNSAMYNVCRSELNSTNATYAHLNRMLAMCFSNLTSMERFPGTLPCSISSILNNVLPFRRLKHLLLGCSPFTPSDMISKEKLNVIGITSSVMETDSQFADVDLRHGRHMAGVLLFRGAAKPSDIEQAVASLKLNRNKIEFVDWAPASFKTGLLELPPLAVPSSGIGGPPLSVTLVSNHTAVSSLFRGHSESIKKLKAGSFFLRYYDVASSGGIKAGHNSSGGIENILNEAVNHMDELVVIYEGDVPPDHLLKAPASKLSRPLVEVKSGRFTGTEVIPSMKLKFSEISNPSSTVRSTLNSVVHKDASRSVAPSDPSAPDYQQFRQSELPNAGQPTVSLTGLNVKQEKSISVTKEQSVFTPAAEKQYSLYVPGGSQLVKTQVAASPAIERNVSTTSIVTTENLTNLKQPSDPHRSVGPVADSQIAFSQAPQSQYIPSTQGTTTTETTPAATPTVAETARPHKSRGVKKATSGGCCGGSKKPQPKMAPQGATTLQGGQNSLDYTLRQRAQSGQAKRNSGGCCGGGGSGAGGATKRPTNSAVRNKSNMRSQSQNHANSENLRYPLDTESIKSIDGYSDIHVDCHPSDQVESESTVQNHIQEYFTNSLTDSAADIDDIIEDCLPERISLNCTLSTVRQIIKKYNEMFSQGLNGSQSATTVPRTLN